MKRVAILISGGGSNMAALLASMTVDHPGQPVLVLSNRADAGGLVKAQTAGVETAVIDHTTFGGDRRAFETALAARLDAAKPDLICLAGFMRILSPEFVARFAGRILNIHPSLLPKYPGLHTHSRAIDAGDDWAGCTVHDVTAELDSGPIRGQAKVPIKSKDTPQTLAARVLRAEHRLYPAVVERVCRGAHEPLYLPPEDGEHITN